MNLILLSDRITMATLILLCYFFFIQMLCCSLLLSPPPSFYIIYFYLFIFKKNWGRKRQVVCYQLFTPWPFNRIPVNMRLCGICWIQCFWVLVVIESTVRINLSWIRLARCSISDDDNIFNFSFGLVPQLYFKYKVVWRFYHLYIIYFCISVD